MQQHFTVVDFETANEDMASICQIGIAYFADGVQSGGWVQLVNPQDEFSGMNISIHGIDESDVCDSPAFPAIYPRLINSLTNTVAVSHTHFDRVALKQACAKYALPLPDLTWLDSARVVRRCWPDEFGHSGYGLKSQAKYHGIIFSAHDALEDARCAGEVLLRAIAKSGMSAEGWIECINHPRHTKIERDGDFNGALFGEIVVFTGSLTMARHLAADVAAAAGCQVDERVTKHTTLLVVGDQDIRKLAGHDKSHKHSEAEQLIAKGNPIRIICERDFMAMTAS